MGKGDFTPLSCLEAAERLIEICPGSFRSMWGWEHAAEVNPPPLPVREAWTRGDLRMCAVDGLSTHSLVCSRCVLGLGARISPGLKRAYMVLDVGCQVECLGFKG